MVFPFLGEKAPVVDSKARLRTTLCSVLLCATCFAQSPKPSPLGPQHGSATQDQSTPDNASGSISGVVNDKHGTPISGAHVAFSSAGRASGGETTSDGSGHFQFSDVPAGYFTVMVTLQGFDTASASGTLEAGKSYELSPFALAISTVSVTVDAVTSTQELGLEELHTEEQQRLLGLFPNFFVSYNWQAQPLTPRQKFALCTKNVLDPGNLLLVGLTAGVQQADDAFPGYNQGAAGFGKRYGADLGNLVSGSYLGGAVFPVLFRQDPRYFYKGTGTIRARFLYAISTAVRARGDNGEWQPAYASVLGDLSAGAISNLYYAPSDRQGAALTFENGLLGIAGDALSNVFQEFFSKGLTPKSKKKSATTP